MSGTSTSSDAEDVGGILNRVNQLGTATEKLFSRLYDGLNRRSKAEEQERRQELENKIEAARRVQARNKELQESLAHRIGEVERLQGILSTLDEGIIMQDNDGRIVFINKSARDLLGSQKNFWQSELGVLFDDYREIVRVDNELEPLGDPVRVQVNNRVLGAQLAAVANFHGERLGTMIVLRDVTRDAVTDRLKDQFVTAISHELKTPMTVIKGMAEVLLSHPQDQMPNRRLLETLSRNVDILDMMVVELLDVSEMGAETFTIRQDKLHLEPLIWSVVKALRPEANKKRQDILVMARNTEALLVRGDDQRLRWAIKHLLQNSIFYTLNDGYINVIFGVHEDDPRYVAIDFRDNGVGISERDLPNIFDRFYRGDPRDERGKLVDPRGLGQGLFIARTVAEAHGGYLSVRSEVGRGSTFTLVLPALSD